MRPIPGFDRPQWQWAVIAASVLVTCLAAGEAILLRRARAANAALHAESLEAKIQQQQLQITLSREREAREALSGRPPAAPPASAPATLTLEPVRSRGASPPQPTIDAPAPGRVVDLRLRLPASPDPRLTSYRIAFRQWSTGLTLWSRGGLAPSVVEGRPMVAALLVGDVLVPGAYEVALSATGPDGAVVEVASYDAAVRPPAR